MITASTLYDLVCCPTRVRLDLFGDPSRRDPVSAFVELLWKRGNAYERKVVETMEIPVLDLSNLPPAQRERETLDAMRQGEPLIYGGRMSFDDLLGEPDLLRLDTTGYTPGDIKSGRGEEGDEGDEDPKPKLHYAVQLALYVELLERLSLSSGRRAFVHDIRGREVGYDFTAPLGPKNPETLWDRYRETLNTARLIASGQQSPPAAYSSGCKLCHWYTNCLNDLTRSDDLTLVPALGRSRRDSMYPRIPTVTQLSQIDPGTFADPKKKKATVFRGIGPSSLQTFRDRAKLLKTPNAQPYLKTLVSLPVLERELFFDIEVDPMREICYLHGFVERTHQDNSQERFVAFFAEEPTPEVERYAFAEAWAYIQRSQPTATFYYSKYERTIYRNLQSRYPEVCNAEDIELFFDPTRSPTIDLYFDVVLPSTEWPTRDYSIKTLARFLGFRWRDNNPSGAASIEWYHKWVETHDPEVRQRILDYNEDDCRATRVLLDGIRSL